MKGRPRSLKATLFVRCKGVIVATGRFAASDTNCKTLPSRLMGQTALDCGALAKADAVSSGANKNVHQRLMRNSAARVQRPRRPANSILRWRSSARFGYNPPDIAGTVASITEVRPGRDRVKNSPKPFRAELR